jgi:hypothetical protein
MIELVPLENDDAEFLRLTQRIVDGAVAELHVRDVFLVHVDTWFDHKWLGWWSWKGDELRVPPFTPSRVQSEKRLIWNPDLSAWTVAVLDKPLHIRQPGRALLGRSLDRFAKDAAFIWYSGATATNTLGCLMCYRSGPERYSWYASMAKRDHWAIAEARRISREELLWFEEYGVRSQSAQA